MTEEKKLLNKSFRERELEWELKLFEKQPVLAIAKYLECFDTDGEQTNEIPSHILLFLARRFEKLMHEEVGTLDKAFGGKVVTQRNSILVEPYEYRIVYQMQFEMQEARKLTHLERARNTPFEIAREKVAKEFQRTEASIERIYKKSKQPE
jgi:hypothetical protein